MFCTQVNLLSVSVLTTFCRAALAWSDWKGLVGEIMASFKAHLIDSHSNAKARAKAFRNVTAVYSKDLPAFSIMVLYKTQEFTNAASIKSHIIGCQALEHSVLVCCMGQIILETF